MNGDQFIRKTRKLAKAKGVPFSVNRKRGKGSHAVVYFGDRKTTVQQHEIPNGTLFGMCKSLGIKPEEL